MITPICYKHLRSFKVIFKLQEAFTVQEIPPAPESISHKQLKKLFSQAKKDFNGTSDQYNPSTEEKEKLEKLLFTWATASKELLKGLRECNSSLSELKCPNSLLALGAMEAHINMALQALKAFGKDDQPFSKG